MKINLTNMLESEFEAEMVDWPRKFVVEQWSTVDKSDGPDDAADEQDKLDGYSLNLSSDDLSCSTIDPISSDTANDTTHAEQTCKFWSFEIIYSPIWSSPVLYFTTTDRSGSPVITRIEGVSQTEHPITGRPTYYVHPCMSEELAEEVGVNAGQRMLFFLSVMQRVVGVGLITADQLVARQGRE